MRTFKHLTWDDRLKIETLHREGFKPKYIAGRIGCHISTIYRELGRGVYERLNSDYTTIVTYSPEIADEKYKKNLAAKGAPLKIGKDYKLANHIEEKILNEKYSPAAVLGEIKAQGLQFSTMICVTTLYTYIDNELFLHITNKNLPTKPEKKNKYRRIRRARAPKGDSIEKRPEEINARTTFGHWEMDCVEGKKGTNKALLVLTERLSRRNINIPIPHKTAECVVEALDALERKYGALFPLIFKTITIDNGSEFANTSGMELSKLDEKMRTKTYYCHPSNPQERGSNENQNKLIRRHFPKGTNFDRVPDEEIAKVEIWMNNYPRKIFEWHTAEEMFQKYMAELVPVGCGAAARI